jgi:hypothetical protein
LKTNETLACGCGTDDFKRLFLHDGDRLTWENDGSKKKLQISFVDGKTSKGLILLGFT